MVSVAVKMHDRFCKVLWTGSDERRRYGCERDGNSAGQETQDQTAAILVCTFCACLYRQNQPGLCCADNESGTGDRQPAVRIRGRNFLLGLLPVRNPQQSHPSQDRRARLDSPHSDHVGRDCHANWLCAFCPSALCRAFCTRHRGVRIISRYRSVLGVLVPAARKGAGHCLDFDRHTDSQHIGGPRFRFHSGSRPRVRSQQLEMATHSRRFARCNTRVSSAFPVAEQTGRGEVSERR